MKLRMVLLIALMLVAPACGAGYVGAPIAGGADAAVISAVPHARTQAAMEHWMDSLPASLRRDVAMYSVGEQRVTLYVNGRTAQARRIRVRRLCRHLAHRRIGDARHVFLLAEAFENAHRLAFVPAGGTCHIRRRV